MSNAESKFTYRITAEGVDAVKQAFRDLAGQIATAAGIGGIGFMIENSLKAATNIEEMSKQAGMGTKAFQEISYALQKYGIDQGKATDELAKFNANAALFVTTNAGPAKKAFETLFGAGPEGQKAVQEGLKNTDQFFQIVLGKIGNLKSEAEKIELLKAIFGKSGQDLIGPADVGIQALQAFREEAERVGAVMSDEVIKKGHDAELRMQEFANILHMQVAVAIDENADKLEHLAQVGIDVLPAVVDLIDRFASGLERAAQFAQEIADTDFTTAYQHLSNDIQEAWLNYSFFGSPTLRAQMGASAPQALGSWDQVPPGAIDRMLARPSGSGDITLYNLKDTQFGHNNDFFSGLEAPSGVPKIGDTAAEATAKAESDAYAKLIQNLKLETEAMGTSDREMFIATAQRRLSADATQAQKDQVAQLAGNLYDEKQSWEELKKASEETGNAISSSLEDAIVKGKNFHDVLRSLAQTLEDIAYKYFIGDPLSKTISGFLEGSGSGSGGLFGNIFGGLFGGGGSVDTSSGQSVDVPDIGPIQSFDVGTDYVPYDMVAQIHKGERILTAEQNRNFGAAARQTGPVFNVDMRGASVEAVARLEQMVQQLNGSIETRALYAVQQKNIRTPGGG